MKDYWIRLQIITNTLSASSDNFNTYSVFVPIIKQVNNTFSTVVNFCN